MTESEMIIPPDMLKLIKEHQALRREYAASLPLLRQLEQLKDQLPERGKVQALPPLTQAGTPVSELTAVLPQLKQRLEQIARLEAEIQQQEHTLLTVLQSDPLPYTPHTPRSQREVTHTEESKKKVVVVGITMLFLILLLLLLFVVLLH
jgi:hypothetical protein